MSEPVVAQKSPYEVELKGTYRYAWCACGLSAHLGARDNAGRVYRREERDGVFLRLQAFGEEALLRRDPP